MAELLALRHDRVAGATAWKDARLRVEFMSGRVISAHSTGRYESWEVSGKDWTIVGTPGEVTIWGEDSRKVTVDSSELGELLERLNAEGRTSP
jgi:lipocalin